jgi:mono/diheme cytochrome c family protein
MEYPVWYLPQFSGGSLIALIAVTHVFVAHFAVGGGLYLVLAERLGLREGDPGVLDFTRRHARFFILVTLVYGSLTGVGIWFAISLVQPTATSLLIHNFVFFWAAEWVFFLVEIVAAMVYFYTFGRMRSGSHQVIGWIYFVSAWCSLFLINGIITFMMAPGGWLESGNPWEGFFNPTFWPSLLVRTFLAIFLAGVYAFVSTAFLRDVRLKRRMTRFSSWWVLIAALGALPSGWWYLRQLPAPARNILAHASPQLAAILQAALWMAAAGGVLSLIFCLLRPQWHNKIVALLVLVCGLGVMGGFEWAREGSRRPFVIYDRLYSNSIPPQKIEMLNAQGFLSSARWSRDKEVSETNRATAGEDLFKFQCYACHTLGGRNNDLSSRTAGIAFEGMTGYIENLHAIRPFMPPFAGTVNEARTLAAWLVKDVNGIEIPAQILLPDKAIEPEHEDRSDLGESLFQQRCSPCHGLREGGNAMNARVRGWDRDRIRAALDDLPRMSPAMPPLMLPAEQKDALADFLAALAQE